MDKEKKALTDEIIIAQLMQGCSVSDIAGMFGVTPRTIYNRMTKRDFIIAYHGAKGELLSSAAHAISHRLTEAIEAIADIMTDENVNAATRLQAAQTLLTNAGKFLDRQAETEEKLRDMIDPMGSLDDMRAALGTREADTVF